MALIKEFYTKYTTEAIKFGEDHPKEMAMPNNPFEVFAPNMDHEMLERAKYMKEVAKLPESEQMKIHQSESRLSRKMSS